MENSYGNMFILTPSSSFSHWRARMEDILYCEDLHDPIEGDKAKPTKMSDAEWELLNRRTVAFIRQWIDDSLFHLVAQETNAQSLWKELENICERKTALSKLSLMTKLTNLRYKEGDSMAKHMADFQDIVNQLINLEIMLPDETQAYIFLSTMPNGWEFLSNCVDSDDKLSLSLIKEKLFIEDIRRKEQEKLGWSQTRNFPNSNNHDKKSGGPRSREEIICYHCGKQGHVEKHCRVLKGEQLLHRNRTRKEDHCTINLAVAVDNEQMAKEVDALLKESWIFVACDFHVSSKRDWFDTFDASHKGYVTLATGDKLEIEGIGNVKVKMHDGKVRTLGYVRYVPKFLGNVISISHLASLGCGISVKGGLMEVFEGGSMLMKGEMTNVGLYKLDGSTIVAVKVGDTHNGAKGIHDQVPMPRR